MSSSSGSSATLLNLTKRTEIFHYDDGDGSPITDPRIIWGNSEETDMFTFFLSECYGCKSLTTVYNLPEGFLYCKDCFSLLFNASRFSKADYEHHFLTNEQQIKKEYDAVRQQANVVYQQACQLNETCQKLQDKLKQNEDERNKYCEYQHLD